MPVFASASALTMVESQVGGQTSAHHSRAFAFVFVAVSLGAACGSGPPPVAPEVVAAEEQRLLRPFQVKRVVISDTVELTLSANFIGSRVAEADIDATGSMAANRVALPGIDKNLHQRSESRNADGVFETYFNKAGGVERPLRVLVGQTDYRALQGLTVHVLPSGATMALTVVARGEVTVLAGADKLEVPEFAIRDGLWLGQ